MRDTESRLTALEQKAAALTESEDLYFSAACQMTDEEAAAMLERSGLPSPAEIEAMDVDALWEAWNRACEIIEGDEQAAIHLVCRFCSIPTLEALDARLAESEP